MSISTREVQVLHLIAEEHTNHEIAKKLFISAHTVISHRKAIMSKLNARNTAGLIRRAFEANLLQINNPSNQSRTLQVS
jgi:DNA-binding NarL/FixJ family response regulator